MLTPDAIALIFVAIFGLCVGSFLNVVIARIPEGRSIVFPGSACPKCGKSIAWYDNLPVLSYALLRGRCRNCREPISWRYPAVEVACGLLFVLAYSRFEAGTGPGTNTDCVEAR